MLGQLELEDRLARAWRVEILVVALREPFLQLVHGEAPLPADRAPVRHVAAIAPAPQRRDRDAEELRRLARADPFLLLGIVHGRQAISSSQRKRARPTLFAGKRTNP